MRRKHALSQPPPEKRYVLTYFYHGPEKDRSRRSEEFLGKLAKYAKLLSLPKETGDTIAITVLSTYGKMRSLQKDLGKYESVSTEEQRDNLEGVNEFRSTNRM
jgi:hypothetical protein